MSEKIIVLYACRHGSTTLNGQDCFRGKIDVPLDKAGFRDAHALAHYLDPLDLSFIVHSDRKRTEQTAKIIAGEKNMPMHSTPNLRAWNVGEFSGQPKSKENIEAVEWYVDHPDSEIPEGESLNDFKSRVRPAIMEAVELSNNIGEPGLIVVHSSIIHEISSMLHGDHEAVLVEPGGVVAIYADRGGLKSEAIFKSRTGTPKSADTVS